MQYLFHIKPIQSHPLKIVGLSNRPWILYLRELPQAHTKTERILHNLELTNLSPLGGL